LMQPFFVRVWMSVRECRHADHRKDEIINK
jgi:hypothetical protein